MESSNIKEWLDTEFPATFQYNYDEILSTKSRKDTAESEATQTSKSTNVYDKVPEKIPFSVFHFKFVRMSKRSQILLEI